MLTLALVVRKSGIQTPVVQGAMACSFFFVLAATIVGATSGKTHPSFLPRNKPALSIRGGAGQLDVTDRKGGNNHQWCPCQYGCPFAVKGIRSLGYGFDLTPTSTLLTKHAGAT